MPELFHLYLLPHICLWIYVAATLVQLAFLWGVAARLACRLLPDRTVPQPAAGASVVICARNEAHNLRRYLPKILAQEYPGEWEVIVVDDASEDDTPAVLEGFREKHGRLRVLRVPEKTFPGKKYALSQGIAAARFGHLFFTDADCEPASVFWLSHMAAALSEKTETDIVLGYGPMRASIPGTFLNGWARFETAQTAIQYLGFARAGMPYMGVGRNLAWKRKVFDRAGGFSAHLTLPSGDDDLLVNAAATRTNTVICLHPESFMYSEGATSGADWLRQKHRHLSAGKRYRLIHKAVLGMLSLSHTLHYFLLVALFSAGFGTITVACLFFVRSFSLLFLYGKIFPKLREFQLLSQVPIYDTLLAAYYGAFAPISLINNQHARKWK